MRSRLREPRGGIRRHPVMRWLALSWLAAVSIACGAGGSGPAPSPVAAQAERDGVVLRIELERSVARPGDVVWIDVVIENRSGHEVTWLGGGCGVPARVTAPLPAGSRPPAIEFSDETSWNMRNAGGRACPAYLAEMKLAAGATLHARFASDLRVAETTVPAGALPVTATFPLGTFAASTPLSATATLTIAQ